MRFCCATCPKSPTCKELADIMFATPEDIVDFFDGPDDPSTTLQRPACPTCRLELPVSGICEECS